MNQSRGLRMSGNEMHLLRMCSIESFDLLRILLRHTRFVLTENAVVFSQIDLNSLNHIDVEK